VRRKSRSPRPRGSFAKMCPKCMGAATLDKQIKEGKGLSPRHLVGEGGGGLMLRPSPDLDLLCFPLFFPSEEKWHRQLTQDSSVLVHASFLSSCDHALYFVSISQHLRHLGVPSSLQHIKSKEDRTAGGFLST
jgi:hypothetical protein